jgi:hypothetical protein
VVETTIGPERIDTVADLEPGDAGVFSFWAGQERIAEKEERRWIERSQKIVKRYRDERPVNDQSNHKLNILWSNIQTLKPTLYSRTPKPDVQRRYLDQDDTGRYAAQVLERALSYTLQEFSFDDVMEAVVEDRLLAGRGTCRVLYIPHYADEPNPAKFPDDEDYDKAEAEDVSIASEGDEDEPRTPTWEETELVYVFWQDYREGPARTWREVPWTRYRAYMTRDELIKRFGSKIGKQVNLDYVPQGVQERPDREKEPPDIFKKAQVHEYWDRSKREVIWIAPGTPDLVLDKLPDPLGLPDFFPSPPPLLATTTNDKRIPVPDFAEYQDQAHELDTLTMRIDRLTRALKISGVYPGENKQVLQQLIDEGTENRLIPVLDWPNWMDKGGLGQFIQFMPLKEIAETLVQLYTARDKTKELLYELTGISDILRGETEPDETLGAQRLKSVFATRRIQPQQHKTATFATNAIRLLAAVIAEQFSPATLSAMTNMPALKPVPKLPPEPPLALPEPPQAPQAPPGGNVVPMQPGAPGQPPGAPGMPPAPQMVPNPAHAAWQQAQQAMQAVMAANAAEQKKFDDAYALIRKDGIKGFRLDVEADSTIAPDEQAEQASRTEFLQQMIPLLEQVIPIAQGNPPLAALAKEITLFAVRGFRVGRQLEEAFEKAFDAVATMPPVPPKGAAAAHPPPNPQLEAAKVAADVHDTQTTAATAQAATAQKAQQAQLQFQASQQRDAVQERNDQAKLALSAAELHQRGVLESAKVASMAARGAQGLT